MEDGTPRYSLIDDTVLYHLGRTIEPLMDAYRKEKIEKISEKLLLGCWVTKRGGMWYGTGIVCTESMHCFVLKGTCKGKYDFSLLSLISSHLIASPSS